MALNKRLYQHMLAWTRATSKLMNDGLPKNPKDSDSAKELAKMNMPNRRFPDLIGLLPRYSGDDIRSPTLKHLFAIWLVPSLEGEHSLSYYPNDTRDLQGQPYGTKAKATFLVPNFVLFQRKSTRAFLSYSVSHGRKRSLMYLER